MKLILLVLFMLFTTPTSAVPNADLAIVSNTANIKHAHMGQLATFTIIAVNNGPDPVPTLDVYFNIALQGVQIVRPICDQGVSADGIVCEYHQIAPGQRLTTIIIVRLIKTVNKTAKLTACVESETAIRDSNLRNNCATGTLKQIGRHI